MDPSPHILIVDDHKDIRDLVAKYLQLHGLRVSKAENARAARRLFPAGAIDLVVLDIMMPGEDGLSLCRHLRESTDIPVILLTAMADETDRPLEPAGLVRDPPAPVGRRSLSARSCWRCWFERP